MMSVILDFMFGLQLPIYNVSFDLETWRFIFYFLILTAHPNLRILLSMSNSFKLKPDVVYMIKFWEDMSELQ